METNSLTPKAESMETDSVAVTRQKDVTTLATGAGTALVGKLGGQALSAFGDIILARVLGVELFGIYAIGWTILRIAGLITPLGLQNGIIRYGPRYWPGNNSSLRTLIVRCVGYAILSGLLAAGILFFVAPWLASSIYQKPELVPVFRLFAIAFPLAAGLRVAAAGTRLTQRTKYSAFAEDLGLSAANFVLIIATVILGLGVFGAILADIGGFLVGFLLAIYFLGRLFPGALKAKSAAEPHGKELLYFSLPTAFTGLFTIFLTWTDRLIIGYSRAVADAGIYQAVSQSSIAFGVILSAFTAIFAPMISDLYNKKEFSRLEELFRISTKWALYTCIPLFLVFIFAPRESLMLVFGHPFGRGALPLMILAVSQLVDVGTGAVSFLLIMSGHQKQWFYTSAIILLINLVLNWFLIPEFGLVGAALVRSLSIMALFLIGLFQVKHYLNLWPYDRRYFKGVMAASVAAFFLYLLKIGNINPPSLYLSLVILLAVGIFTGLLLMLGLDDEDREFIRLAKLRSRRFLSFRE